MRVSLIAIVLLLPTLALVPVHTAAEQPASEDFRRTWERTDKPVSNGLVSRTWMWGPEAFTGPVFEQYAEAPDGRRLVQYFDKSRMEISDPDGDPDAAWYVTNGLLAKELITGMKQVAEATFEEYTPAEINVAGDVDDPTAPTYASFGVLMGYQPFPIGGHLTQRVDRDSFALEDPSLVAYDVTVAYLDDVTNHTVASPFWEFMNSEGLTWDGNQFVERSLFPDPLSSLRHMESGRKLR